MGRIADRIKRRAIARTLRAPKAHELQYQRALTGMMRTVHTEAMKWLTPRLDQLTAHADQNDPAGVVAKTQLSSEWMGHVDGLVRTLGPKVEQPFMKLAHETAKQNAKVLSKIGLDVRGQLGPELDTMREWNRRLMISAGRDYAADVAKVLDDPKNWGLTLDELTERLLERADVSESRATLIARDQTAKTAGSINQFRQRNAGVKSYVWSGSLDERERETHLANEGKEFDWNDPPAETGHPTEDVQCRCVAVPVIPELADEEAAAAPDMAAEE